MTIQNYYGTGRRKSAVAKVFMQKGEGVFTVNNTSLDNYFKRGNALIARIHQPLIILELLNTFNVIITVKGGGERGQADAIRLGISRALLKYDEFNSNDKDDVNKNNRSKLHDILRNAGMLTRDSRVVERKKVGHHKARKSSQFSKR